MSEDSLCGRRQMNFPPPREDGIHRAFDTYRWGWTNSDDILAQDQHVLSILPVGKRKDGKGLCVRDLVEIWTFLTRSFKIVKGIRARSLSPSKLRWIDPAALESCERAMLWLMPRDLRAASCVCRLEQGGRDRHGSRRIPESMELMQLRMPKS